MKKLFEIEYEDIFRPETMSSLKGKSGESLRQMLGNKSLMQTMRNSSALLGEIIQAEKGYRDQLELIAADMVTKIYPIIDYANIRIDAEIVDAGNINIQTDNDEEDPSEPDFGSDDSEKLKAKRRIINGITQGASIRGAFSFYLFREYIDRINPQMIDKYAEILKLSFGIYDDENAIAMLLSMLAQNQKIVGGASEMVFDEDKNQFVIKAKAICFPMLVHEIVKGLYEIVGTEGFGADKEKNQAVIGAVDKVSNEPRDLQYGKFIYDALNNLYFESNINDSRVRELFFTEVYKLNENNFLNFIENIINNTLTPSQKKWAMDSMKNIERNLKQTDADDAMPQSGYDDMDDDEEENNRPIFDPSLNEGKRPYKDIKTTKKFIIREFNENVNPIELKWHRDKESRLVKIIGKTDWKIQLENQLPSSINGPIFIPKGEWHRLIKGKGTLLLKINKE